MTRTIRDAAGRPIHVGDIVGGSTNFPRATVTGEVTEIGPRRVQLTVATVSAARKDAPRVGSSLWLPARLVFLVHAKTPQVQTVVIEHGQVTSVRWTGKAADLRAVAEFAGRDLIGALDGEDGWTLLLRTSKGFTNPEVVPPGWFVLRPSSGRHRACDPTIYAASYAPTATAHVARSA
ncbi:hypothetical protein [Streptomyces sp. NPDC047070]|uniref:hypothetical protein n=1 Tax=Streptomyces sp. NPDC047070 TaxID=3154923 RepID=UPI00345468E9